MNQINLTGTFKKPTVITIGKYAINFTYRVITITQKDSYIQKYF